MSIVKMNEFGRTLTDREDGKKTFIEITVKNEYPIALDFSGVISLGSSFGDEIIPKIATMQGDKIEMFNANSVIQNSIKRTVEDLSIKIIFTSRR